MQHLLLLFLPLCKFLLLPLILLLLLIHSHPVLTPALHPFLLPTFVVIYILLFPLPDLLRHYLLSALFLGLLHHLPHLHLLLHLTLQQPMIQTCQVRFPIALLRDPRRKNNFLHHFIFSLFCFSTRKLAHCSHAPPFLFARSLCLHFLLVRGESSSVSDHLSTPIFAASTCLHCL